MLVGEKWQFFIKRLALNGRYDSVYIKYLVVIKCLLKNAGKLRFTGSFLIKIYISRRLYTFIEVCLAISPSPSGFFFFLEHTARVITWS